MNWDFLLFWVILPLIILGLIFVFIRLLKGPSLPSRVIALDMMSVLGIGIIVIYAVVTDQPVFIDVASVLALVSFLGTVAFAEYVERRLS
ncbi:MAG: cation:proton antiporter [Anaerolineales bacterium]|jgi:multicomponent Na+:H+ antiporter subunit F